MGTLGFKHLYTWTHSYLNIYIHGHTRIQSYVYMITLVFKQLYTWTHSYLNICIHGQTCI